MQDFYQQNPDPAIYPCLYPNKMAARQQGQRFTERFMAESPTYQIDAPPVIPLSVAREIRRMAHEHKNSKPAKFFGLEVGDSIKYLIVIILAIIFIRQVSVLF